MGSENYIDSRKRKLDEQSKTFTNDSNIFRGCRIHINGYTGDSSLIDLKQIIIKHGGAFVHYFSKSAATHVVATSLAHTKQKDLSDFPVVKPEWIFDSIENGRLLDWRKYALYPDARGANFIDSYYQNSRLHYLSLWKQELAELVGPLRESLLKKKPKFSQKIIMHVDLDCFFASVSLLGRPDLVDKPVGISHGSTTSTGAALASCNYLAREKGVKNGMLVSTAMNLCPNLVLLPYNFDEYKKISIIFYRTVVKYADDIQAVSCDEVYISTSYHGSVIDYANEIRAEIKQKTQCNASIGISENMLLARIATAKAKPNGVFYLTKQDFHMISGQIQVHDLPGIGKATATKLEENGIYSCSDLQGMSKQELAKLFGPNKGENLYNMARGVDTRDFKIQQRQSISADVNYGIRFTTKTEVDDFIKKLIIEFCTRLNKQNVAANQLTIKIMKKASEKESIKYLGHGICDTFSKSINIVPASDDVDKLTKHATDLLESFKIAPQELRGLGISSSKLVPKTKPNIFQSSYKKDEIDWTVFSGLPIEIQKELGQSLGLDKELTSKVTPLNIFDALGREIDMDVYRELPDDIRDEIFNSKKRELLRKSNLSSLGSSIDETREILYNWMKNIDETNIDADCIKIKEYLIGLINQKRLSDLQLIIKFIKYLETKFKSILVLEDVIKEVETKVCDEYKCNSISK